MELIRLAALGAALALALGGCGTPGGASSAPASGAPPASSSGEPAPEEPRERLGSGGVYYEEDVEPLEGEQEVLLRDYMTAYYEALARLEPGDPGEFFSPDAEAQALGNGTVWAFLAGLRGMQRTDLSLTSYRFELTVTGVEEEDDGSVSVSATEYSVQNFAAHPEVDSESFGVRHQFTLVWEGGRWLLSGHMQMDSLYYGILGRAMRPGSGGELSSGYYEGRLQELLDAAARDTALRLTQGEEQEVSADHPYDREAAVAYAHRWTGVRSSDWPDYSRYGGNCQNFVSQCLYAGGIPMDPYGYAVWKWYGETPNNLASFYGRSASWSSVEEFLSYAGENAGGYGLAAVPDAPYYSGEPGDVIHLGRDGEWRHTVLIVDTVEEDGETVDYLIDSNTADLRNFPVSAYAYTDQLLIRICGWNEG